MKTAVILLCGLLPAAVLGQCFSADDNSHSPDASEHSNIFQGERQFTMDMLITLNDKMPSENIFFSPFSVYNALTLAYFTAANHTEQAIKKVLHIPETVDKSSLMRSYVTEKVLQRLDKNHSSDYELLTANRLFVSNKLSVRDCMKHLFMDEIVPTDFIADPKTALDTINNWVAAQTKNNIKDLLKGDQVTSATRLVLANAAYFKGFWKTKFQPQETKMEVFYITTSQNAFVTMMRQKGTFYHSVSDLIGAHVLELPYKGDAISLYLLLPPFTSSLGITNILKRMQTKTSDFQSVIDKMLPRQVDVSIPKFNIEHELQLAGVLESMGVGDLFNSSADLSGLTGSNDITLDDAIHKAKITLDEEGTTAAAATALFNFRSSRPLDPVKFNCNHPFVYIIYNKMSKVILFAGIFNKPPPV